MMQVFPLKQNLHLLLGLGFRCGFLGLLHLEIITERLEREFDVNLLTTTPGVVYKVKLNNGDIKDLQNPSSLPDPTSYKIYRRALDKSYCNYTR